MSLDPGTRLGPYEIGAPIGAGGMGDVYRARDTKLDRDVAIKVLPEELAADEERVARFEREAKLLASLNHPNIASIYGFEEANGVRALALELVEGPTLAERIAQGPIPVEDAVIIAKQIAEALEAGHEAGVIHRDLKPANIKVKEDGTVKVLDYGLAKALEGEAAAAPDSALSQSPTLTRQGTELGVILGTAAYMSPEQARGKRVDKRTDIWAFGAVVAEMMSGRRAFGGDDVTETLASVIKSEPNLAGLPSSAPPRLRELLGRCLEKDLEERWHDIADVRIELGHAISSATASSASTIVPRNRFNAFAPGLVAGMLVAVLTAAVSGYFASDAGESEVVRVRERLDEGFAFLAPQQFALSPDGTLLAYADESVEQIRLRSLDDFDTPTLRGTEGAMNTVFFSPDGEWIGFWDTAGFLKKVETAGGTAVTLCATEAPFGASWGSEGAIVFATADGLFHVSANGGEATLVAASMEGERFQSPRFLPGGRTLLLTVAKEDRSGLAIEVLSLESGERKKVLDRGSDAHYLSGGFLVFGDVNTLHAARFDARQMKLLTEPIPVLEGVSRTLYPGGVFAMTTSDRSLAYLPLLSGGRVAAVDERGSATLFEVDSGSPVWPHLSPDGRSLLVVTAPTPSGSTTRIWHHDITSGHRRRLVEVEAGSLGPMGAPPAAIWSPNGTRFTYSQDGGIFERGLDENAPVPLWESDRPTTPWSWSPDGRFLAFVEEHPETGLDAWVLDAEDGTATPLASSPDNELFPSFSPDGQWIAYATPTVRDDAWVWVSKFPKRGAPIQVVKGNWVGWGPDGRSLLIRTPESELHRIPIDLDDNVAVGEPTRLMAGQSFYVASSVTRDGRVLMTLTDIGGEIRIVLNWTEELKRLAPLDH